jgi:hypothetical protein
MPPHRLCATDRYGLNVRDKFEAEELIPAVVDVFAAKLEEVFELQSVRLSLVLESRVVSGAGFWAKVFGIFGLQAVAGHRSFSRNL